MLIYTCTYKDRKLLRCSGRKDGWRMLLDRKDSSSSLTECIAHLCSTHETVLRMASEKADGIGNESCWASILLSRVLQPFLISFQIRTLSCVK